MAAVDPTELGRPEADPGADAGASASAAGFRSSLSRSASQILGVPSQAGQAPTRQELIESGVPPREADAALVQAAELDLMALHFVRVLSLFSLLLIVVSITLMALWIWLVAAFAEANRKNDGRECEVPLRVWTIVVIVVWILRNFFKPCIDRLLCCWSPSANQRPPPRVQAKDGFVLLAEFVWVTCFGLYWISQDGQGDGLSCEEMAPTWFLAAKVYICFSTAATALFWLSALGLHGMLRLLLRRGLLATSDAAPPDTINKSTQEVQLTEAELAETPSCPICIADFDRQSKAAAKVKACGHIFHKQCLKNWLKVARTCPLCRIDLVKEG